MRIGYLLYRLIDYYELLIIVECVLSWIPAGGIIGDVREALRRITDPFVDLFRRVVPDVGGAGMRIDFSPMIAIVVLDIVKRFVIRL